MSIGTVALNTSPRKMTMPVVLKNVLVVDDSETILHAICALLEHHEVVKIAGKAESGQQAIDAVVELKPDLVLMDADMPGMSGLRTALLLSQVSPETQIVMMSMDTSEQFKTACAGCGASAVIYKPKFLYEMSTLLQRPPAQHEAAAPYIRIRLKAAPGMFSLSHERGHYNKDWLRAPMAPQFLRICPAS